MVKVKTIINEKIYKIWYLQNTFNFIDVSFIPRFTNSLDARHTSILPLSVRVGVKLKMDEVTLPSDETYFTCVFVW